MFAEINGTTIYFDVEGSSYKIDADEVKDKPVCFILHGGPGGTHSGFKSHLSSLTEHLQIVYLDNRGSGLSARGSQESYSLENNVEDVEALRKYLGLDKIMIFGHSYGGMVAQSYALKYQNHLEALLLMATSSSYRFIEDAKAFIEDNGTKEQKEMADILWAGAFESEEQLMKYYKVMQPLYYYSDYPQKNKRLKFSGKRSYQALNEGFGNFLREFDVTDSLHHITVPTLVLGGEHDWITPLEHSKIIANNIPDSQLTVFEKSSHLIIQDEREKFLNTVNRFIINIRK